MEKKKVENKKQVKPTFDREDLLETTLFLKRCKKEIAFCTIKPVKTSKKDEMENLILFRGKKICQICFSKVAFFSQYRFEKKSRSIFKPTNQIELDEAFAWVVARVQEIEDDFEERKITKKDKSTKSEKTKSNNLPIEEELKTLKSRMENLSVNHSGVKTPSRIDVHNEKLRQFVESNNWKLNEEDRIVLKIEG